MSTSSFRDLRVCQEAMKLTAEIYKATVAFPRHELNGLSQQIRRAAVSVPSNIAEGDERKSDKDSVRFFYIAKGSLAELSTQLEIARDVGYFTDAQVEPFVSQCVELGKMLGALIRARSQSEPRAPSPKPRA